jgi:hypothetical protein
MIFHIVFLICYKNTCHYHVVIDNILDMENLQYTTLTIIYVLKSIEWYDFVLGNLFDEYLHICL